jgi:hypothetical protein
VATFIYAGNSRYVNLDHVSDIVFDWSAEEASLYITTSDGERVITIDEFYVVNALEDYLIEEVQDTVHPNEN